ncbi:tRNA modification GTPase MnmE [uncultured Roseburia sp.]|uniref:[FeFe] hydrogenase H-cluster maturation GTPase HydF n=1 Tax=Brotonthovivens ammoniilytica TaxID=2981725 RepID=A0ABT2TJ43_9FIRM|nr:[FeFe] hydrogenase H-cluster maturation GTPase HydF [Brotonthovivens ammoniilytica]MCU6761861.1 [FeFe] hydrogenase H-cluster maturation GTPase HydF [Brotonthovivens ammoniilytica]SCI48836.1 tRNA modification GTPase MnmE [uncultured Roseburia sp.]
MSLNATPSSDRVHIGIFGRRNAGKSSIINAITGQSLAIVSDVKGTTTDPVSKAMELLPLGPVVMIDTPGLDDEGKLGALRIRKSYQVLNKTDIAVLVADAGSGVEEPEKKLIQRFKDKKIPYVIAVNKSELLNQQEKEAVCHMLQGEKNLIFVSAVLGTNITELKELIAKQAPKENEDQRIVGDLLRPSDLAVLVVPVDKAAPKGRLILPQQQTIRDILEADAAAVVTKENTLKETLKKLGEKPKLVITDSQVFEKASADTPEDIMLTSFSILFARYKGNLAEMVRGVTMLERLKDGDTVLISEGCTHHRQCDDIGTVKLPGWILKHTGKNIKFAFTSGTEFPEDLSPYALVIHCGGCMLNEREMKYRIKCALDQETPITNYGISIAYMTGILKRSLEPFPEILKMLA